MSKLNPGVKVFVIDENHEMKKGVINAVHESVSIAIVKFDDGSVEKVNVNCLGIYREEPTEETKEPVEKTEITITPEKFKKIAMKVMKEDLKEMDEGAGLLGMTFLIFITKLHKALFFDAVEDD